jgi:hypothetical protein
MDNPKLSLEAGNLPIPSDLVEPSNPAERERQLVEAEAEIEAGHFKTQEEVRTWLSELVAGRDVPRPCDY